MHRFFSVLVLVLVLDSLPSPFIARAEEPKYKAMPWHLVDLWWDTGKDAPFENYSIDVTLSDDVPESVNLYVAPVGIAHLNKSAFYGGMQTQSDGKTKSDPKLRGIGRGLIFSMWGERSLDAIRTAEGGFCQSAGNEGDYVSVRRPYAWKKGTYTYRVAKLEKEMVNDKPATWVGAYVLNHETKEDVLIGALRFPGENLVLSRGVASFVEIYGRAKPVSEIPKVTITFANLKVNGEPVKAPAPEAHYPPGVPDYAAAKATSGGVIVEVGQAVTGRSERKVKLTGG